MLFEAVLFITAIIVSAYFAFRVFPFVKVLWFRIIGKRLDRKLKKHNPGELTDLLIMFVALLTLWVAFVTYKDASELNEKNKLFLDSSSSIIESAKIVNQESVSFQIESIKSLKDISDQAQSILGSANEMNERSGAFLEASKKSLETFKNASEELKGILQSNLELSNKEMSMMNENYQRQVELLNRQADISVSFNDSEFIKGGTKENIPINSNASGDWTKIKIVMGNTGLVSLKEPELIYITDPHTVCIKGSNRPEGCYGLELNFQTLAPINPGQHNDESIEVKIPEDVTKFSVYIQLNGEGLQGTFTALANFVVNHSKLNPTNTATPQK